MRNRDVYERDPATNRLLNQGVAKLTTDRSETELKTLRYELANFVCEGQYEDGLLRILSEYLTNLDRTEQPGVWVSGFFGSGKSHLAKMLQYLWTDFVFDDGAAARGLARLTDNVTASLKELTIRSRRHGGLHAAAGMLGAGASDSVKLALLGIIFRSVGLSEEFAQATFLLWLRQEGLEDAVRSFINAQGRDFDREIRNLYVSEVLARAILDARPNFASKPDEVRSLLAKQFPQPPDISMDDMIATARQALEQGGRLPCTLFILDEVQQYIGQSAERSKAIQDLQEQCCARLGPNVMFVATGQTALSGTPMLQRLIGRFPVTIELQDTDVDRVTRQVVLKKKASAEPDVKNVLDKHSGEIDRQLHDTPISSTLLDREWRVQDYPLLPVRRRFWERVLRAADHTGTGSQLRTQLWMVHDAAERTADLPLGNVVSGAFVYEHVKTRVLQSGVLLQEIADRISRQRQATDGELREQLCALIFLIGQLPAMTGIRANAETLADLLISDLSQSVEVRKRVPELLDELVKSADVVWTGDEYRVQTREGSEWNQAHRLAMNELLNDAGKLASIRAEKLKTACTDLLGKHLGVQHGESKTPRRMELFFGDTAPKMDGSNIPVWIRDGWTTDENSVLSDARAAGQDAAIVYGFIPRKRAEDLNSAIADSRAAEQALSQKGDPATDEGRHAHQAMVTREKQAEQHLNRLVAEILEDTVIFIAGGDAITDGTLKDRVLEAEDSCLDRLYPQFKQADSAQWHRVIERGRKGDADALNAVGYSGNAVEHPVCAAILSYVGSGKRGTEIRKQFGSSPYGWPQDAVDAALVVLHNAGALQARSGSEPIPKGKLEQRNIAAAEFRTETVTLTPVELINVRSVFKKVRVDVKPGEELAKTPAFIEQLRLLAGSAGGDPPLPKRPDTSHIDDIASRTGNDQLKTIADREAQLTQDIERWTAAKERIAEREPRWRSLQTLLGHAESLPIASDVRKEVDAIEAQRSLLGDTYSVPELTTKLTDALRARINEVYGDYDSSRQESMKALESSPTWGGLTEDEQTSVVSACRLDALPKPELGTTETVIRTLETTKLSEWESRRDALPTRFAQAQAEAAKLREPKAQSVHLPKATIRDEDELRRWLDTAEQQIREKLKDGPVIL